MTFRGVYPFSRSLGQSSSVTTEPFVDIGAENCQAIPVTFERPFVDLPVVSVLFYADPTTVVAWASDVTTDGCVLNVYRTAGVDPVTVLWMADAPTQ